jgi:hypothetical protein
MNEQQNSLKTAPTHFQIPVSWHPTEPFCPNISASNDPRLVGFDRVATATATWLPRLVILLTALVLALVFLTGKPCALQGGG